VVTRSGSADTGRGHGTSLCRARLGLATTTTTRSCAVGPVHSLPICYANSSSRPPPPRLPRHLAHAHAPLPRAPHL
jgi:hypothetical protein